MIDQLPNFVDLGRMPYTQAYELQCQHHEQILQGTGHPVVLLVEHDPVITVSRRATASKNLLASPDMLRKLGIDVQPTDRGGDVTYHGPGQLVAYPILRLSDLHMNIGAYMRFLEEVVIQTVAHYGITARRDKANTGVWVDGQAMHLSPAMTLPPTQPAKLCAMGIRVRRNITLHGLALNITTNLTHFQTIIPCGLAGYGVTSLQQLIGPKTPTMAQVKQQFTETFLRCLNQSLHSINKLEDH